MNLKSFSHVGDSFTTRSAKSEEDGDFDCIVLCLGLFVAFLNELCSLSMGASFSRVVF